MKNIELTKFYRRLHRLQVRIIQEAIGIDSELQRRLNDSDDILDDYELEMEVQFCLKEDSDNIIAEPP